MSNLRFMRTARHGVPRPIQIKYVQNLMEICNIKVLQYLERMFLLPLAVVSFLVEPVAAFVKIPANDVDVSADVAAVVIT